MIILTDNNNHDNDNNDNNVNVVCDYDIIVFTALGNSPSIIGSCPLSPTFKCWKQTKDILIFINNYNNKLASLYDDINDNDTVSLSLFTFCWISQAMSLPFGLKSTFRGILTWKKVKSHWTIYIVAIP